MLQITNRKRSSVTGLVINENKDSSPSYNKALWARKITKRRKPMQLQESGEMYLETILILTKEKTNVRSIDVGEYMGFSKPSVSRAIGLLKNGGYVNVDPDGYLTLTDEGREIAEKMYERHEFLSAFLVSLGVPEEIAIEDACKIEHHLSDESFEAIRRAVKR